MKTLSVVPTTWVAVVGQTSLLHLILAEQPLTTHLACDRIVRTRDLVVPGSSARYRRCLACQNETHTRH